MNLKNKFNKINSMHIKILKLKQDFANVPPKHIRANRDFTNEASKGGRLFISSKVRSYKERNKILIK